jgi:hypothetical protein
VTWNVPTDFPLFEAYWKSSCDVVELQSTAWKLAALYTNGYTMKHTCLSGDKESQMFWDREYCKFNLLLWLLENMVYRYLTYKDKCLFVLYGTYKNSYFWIDLNRTLHSLPLGLEETVGYIWTRNTRPLRLSGPFFFEGHCRIMGTRCLPVRLFFAIPLYPWFQLVFAWRNGHDVVTDGGVIHGNLTSLRQVTDITFNRATGSSATALYPSF